MKRFVDQNGTFEIRVPATWKHSIMGKNVHTFQEYECRKSDTFQLSIHSLDSKVKKDNFFKWTKSLSIEKIGNIDFIKFPDNSEDDFTTKMWLKQYDDNYVCFTLIYANNPITEFDKQSVTEKVENIQSILKEFKLIDAEKSKNAINHYRFEMFLQGVGAATLILNKAIDNKAFIEATCILANQIDALLRIGIVLKNQIINSNSEIEVEWIYQGLTDKIKSEKDIYNKALELGIIDHAIYEELYDLYNDRNRVIHRFIISEITLAEVEEIAYKYYKKVQAINKLIYDIESEQIKLNVGMTRVGSDKLTEENHLDYIKGKIGKQDYFDHKN